MVHSIRPVRGDLYLSVYLPYTYRSIRTQYSITIENNELEDMTSARCIHDYSILIYS